MTTLRAVAAVGALVAASPVLAEKRPLATGERVDLNRANAAELMRLPGIGKTRARAIMAARAQRPFRRPEDILSVKGISKAWLERQRGRLTVSPSARAVAPSPAATPAANSDPSQ